MALIDLVRELCSLNDDNLAERAIKNIDVRWCLSELLDILEQEEKLNEPLTLEELREMDGEPVWCEYIGDITFPNQWMIVDCEMNECSNGNWDLPFENEPDEAYGRTWLAYRRPPEGKA